MNQLPSKQTPASRDEGIYMTEQVVIPNPLGWVNGDHPLIHIRAPTSGINGTTPVWRSTTGSFPCLWISIYGMIPHCGVLC
jgi:hypothetical protein